MNQQTTAPESAFAEALRSYRNSVGYADLLAEVRKQLAAGASPAALLEVLRRGETSEPLPANAHEAVVALLSAWRRHPIEAPDESTVILGEGDIDPALNEVPPPASSVGVGDILSGRYRLIELIGTGGMSRVYQATDAQSPSEFLVVKLLTRGGAADPASFAALQSEVEQLKTLAHPNIVRTFGCERDGSAVFVTMEYLQGRSLYAALKAAAPAAGPSVGLDRNDAETFIEAVAEALQYAHERNIVHGDLKPANVIVSPQGVAKVIDFGLNPATAVTPRYASPQLMARQALQATDDVYALACLAYELMTGSHPLDPVTEPGTDLPPRRAELMLYQYAAITNGLRRERADRTPTVRQFIEAFRPPPVPPRSATRGRGWLAAAVVLLGLCAWLYFRPNASQESKTPNTAEAPPIAAPPSSPAPTTTPERPEPSAAAPAAGTLLRDCPACPLLTILPPGQFTRGSAKSDAHASPFEQPQQTVVIAHPFAISVNDITVADFREYAAATDRNLKGCDVYDGQWRHQAYASWQDPGFPQTEHHPASCTSWNDAADYARWLSAKTAHHYRLPSAAEWEYAARAGGDAAVPWDPGGSAACANANVADQSAARRYPGWNAFPCDDGYVFTAPVGSFKANAFGLNDMLGNVFQWTQDCWYASYSGAPTDGSGRSDGDCGQHELRGGSWFSVPAYVRAAYRNHFAANYRTSSVGFRLVREIQP